MIAINPGVMADGRFELFERLRIELGIRSDQFPAWRSFAAQCALCDCLMSLGSHAPDAREDSRLISRLKIEFEDLKSRIETLAAVRPALEDLYDVLSPRQRLRADALLRPHLEGFACETAAVRGAGGRAADRG